MAAHSEYVFEWIKKHGNTQQKQFDDSYFDKAQKTLLPYYEVAFLPPKMMSMTQNIDSLKDTYTLLKEVITQLMPSKNPEKKETLQKQLAKHIFTRAEKRGEYHASCTKELNLKAEHFYLKYQKIILLNVCSQTLLPN